MARQQRFETMDISPEHQELLDEKEQLEARLAEVNKYLKAMEVIEEYRASRNGHVQAELPATGEYGEFGPTEIVKSVLASDKSKWMDLDAIIAVANERGADLDNRYPNPRNNLGVSATKLAKRGAIQRRKRMGKVQYKHVSEPSE